MKPLDFETLHEDYEAAPKNKSGELKKRQGDWRTRKGFTQKPVTIAPISNFTVLHKVNKLALLRWRINFLISFS